LKNLRLFLDTEEEESLSIGLVRTAKSIPDHQLFFKINKDNKMNFSRISDLHIQGEYFEYNHSVFEAFHQEASTCIRFINNKSSISTKRKEINQLFTEEDDVNYLLPYFKDVDYIIKTSDNIADFSVILLPENITFQVQSYKLTSDEELYQLIQYYE